MRTSELTQAGFDGPLHILLVEDNPVLTGRHDDHLAERPVGTGIQDCVEKDGLQADPLLHAARRAVMRWHHQRETGALRERQLRARDELLGHVSHALRTPLNAVYQFVSLMRDGVVGTPDTEQLECLDVVRRNIEELRRMIADLREATRIEAGSVRVEASELLVSPALEELARAAEPIAAERQVALTASIADALPTVLADPTRVRQVVSNLVDNETTRKGLGLGAHLCRELVSRMGGQIWVESELGAGRRFAFTIPIATGTRRETT